MGKELQRLSEEIQNKYLVVSGSPTGRQADAIVNMTDREARAISGSNVSVNKVDTVSEGDQVESGDVVNIAKQLGKCIVDVLRDHGDDLATVTAKNAGKGGVTIKVRYKPDDQGETWEDEFKFTFQDEMVRMENGEEVIDICPLTQQSGTASLSKDLVKDKLKQFIETKGDIETSSEIPADSVPEGLPVDEEQLWESEECYQGFCTAVDQYRQSKDKESVKALLKSSRGFRKGNTIQEKFKNAVDYYKKEKQPVLSEGDLVDGELADVLRNVCQKLRYTMQDLESYANYIYPTGLAIEWCEKIESVLDEIWQKYEDEAPKSLDEIERSIEDELPVESPSDPRSQTSGTIQISPSLLIRLLEYSREDVKDDVEIHDIVEKLSRLGGVASMDDYESLISTEQSVEDPQPGSVLDDQPEGTLEGPEVPEEEPQAEALGDYDEETDRIEGYPEIGDTYTVGGVDFTVIDVAGYKYVLQSKGNPKIMFTWKPGEDMESAYQKAIGKPEEVVGELSSKMLDRATDAATVSGRKNQATRFKQGADDRRKEELGVDSILGMYIHPTRHRCSVQDGNRRLDVYADGTIRNFEDNTLYGDPNRTIISWPLDAKYKLSSKNAKVLARVLVKWCQKYMQPETKDRLKGCTDWHNWVQL